MQQLDMKKTRTAAVAATAAAAAGLAAALVAPAQAAPGGTAPSAPRAATAAPAFLTADELPPHASSDWTAHPVTQGLPDPEPFCAEGVLPASGTSHRRFTTDLDTNATQVVVRAASPAAARKLAAAVEKAVRGCADRVEQQDPEATAFWKDYGPLGAGDGAHVYGVQTARPQSTRDAHLFGVGRDGRIVTLVAWGQMGTLQQAPVPAFEQTTGTAVGKLRG